MSRRQFIPGALCPNPCDGLRNFGPRCRSDVGMYVRRLTMYTPEYPSGRDIILICNDITFMIGSFGVKEDVVYKLVRACILLKGRRAGAQWLFGVAIRSRAICDGAALPSIELRL
jgi:hypothetical protein